MKILAFSHTTAPLLLPASEPFRKTVTRRYWSDRFAASVHADDLMQAYDRNPRNGGQRVGLIRITADPVREPMLHAPDSDYRAEGFEFIDSERKLRAFVLPRIAEMLGMRDQRRAPSMLALWTAWKLTATSPYVVRFETLERDFELSEWISLRYPEVAL